MSVKSLEEFKTDIDILSLDIENLDDASKVHVVQHFEETLKILKLGSSLEFGNPTKKIKLETTEKVDNCTQTDIQGEMLLKEEFIDAKHVPIVDEDYVKELYNGIIPTCNECQAQFPSIGALDKHRKNHNSIGTSNVKLEVKQEPVTSKKQTLAKHEIYPTRKFQCDTCGQKFSEQGILNNHQKDEDNCMKYMNSLAKDQVIIDDEEFKSVSDSKDPDIKRETKSSSDSQKFCDICRLSVIVRNYSRHIEGKVHKELCLQKELGVLPADKNVFVCRTCGLKYKDAKSFSNHLGIHPSNRNIINMNKQGLKRNHDGSIIECKKEPNLEDLKKSSHSKKLDYCKKFIKKSSEEKATESTKQIEQPKFNCMECDTVLTSNKSFELHVKTHEVEFDPEPEDDQEESEDLLQCEQCYKYFASEITFNNHKQSHAESDALDFILNKDETLEKGQDNAKDHSLKFSQTIPDLILDTTR